MIDMTFDMTLDTYHLCNWIGATIIIWVGYKFMCKICED